MRTRYSALLLAFAGSMMLSVGPEAVAQQKYTISQPGSAISKFTQEHSIEVGDVPGHKLRVYQVQNEYPQNELAFAGRSQANALAGDQRFCEWEWAFHRVQRFHHGRWQQGVRARNRYHAKRRRGRRPIHNGGELRGRHRQIQGHPRSDAQHPSPSTGIPCTHCASERRVLDRGLVWAQQELLRRKARV
jgi:hypothetical protein